jgi:hypothetical protein
MRRPGREPGKSQAADNPLTGGQPAAHVPDVRKVHGGDHPEAIAPNKEMRTPPMKFHTNLAEDEIRACLDRAKTGGELPDDIEFDVFGTAGSRSHPHAFEIHLATAQQRTRADGKARSSSPLAGGNGLRYAATYDEWGWFLAEFFAADPEAKAGPYKSGTDFHAKTRYAYAETAGVPTGFPAVTAPVTRVPAGPVADPSVFGPEY